MTKSADKIANAYLNEALELGISGKMKDPAVGHEYYDRLEQESDAVKLALALKSQALFEQVVEMYGQIPDEQLDMMAPIASELMSTDVTAQKRGSEIIAKALGDKISPRQEFALKASRALPDNHPDNPIEILKIYKAAYSKPAMK